MPGGRTASGPGAGGSSGRDSVRSGLVHLRTGGRHGRRDHESATNPLKQYGAGRGSADQRDVNSSLRVPNRLTAVISFSRPTRWRHSSQQSQAPSTFSDRSSAREYLRGGERRILALHEASPSEVARLPRVRERLAAVRKYREASKSKPTRQIANTPALYHVNVLPAAPFLVIPQVSSERRQYVPIGWIEPPTIPSDKLRLLEDASLTDFALLTSMMHMAWMRAVTGRLESRYMYSVGVVYNTFPVPTKDADLTSLDSLAQAILDARTAHPDATLADLYDPDLMPVNLRRAHQALDRAVDRLYRPRKFSSERERVEHLFTLYERMRTPLVAATKSKRRRRRAIRVSGG